MPKGIPKNYVRKEGKGPGRYHKEIPWETVDRCLVAGCSGWEVAAYLGIHKTTLYNACEREKGVAFKDYLLEKRDKGNAQILGKQYELAMNGDRSMLIWLGKNRCMQADKIEQRVQGSHEVVQKKVLCLPDNGRRAIKHDD